MEQARQTGLYVLGAANLALVIAVIVLVLRGPGGAAGPAGVEPDDQRTVAVALANRGLYRQAAEAYEEYLAAADLTSEQRANVLYTVGNLYMERLSDFAEALARFERIRTLYPDVEIASEVNRRIVACLDRLGQTLDAQNLLDAATRAGGETETGAAGTVLARIGDREITDRDLADEIAALPAQYRVRLENHEARLELLRNIVQRELLVSAAVRRGLDRDPNVLREMEQSRKGILAGRMLEDEVFGRIEVTPLQVADYLREHPDEFRNAEGEPMEPARAQRLARQKLAEREQRRLSTRLFEGLMEAQRAQIFEDRVQ